MKTTATPRSPLGKRSSAAKTEGTIQTSSAKGHVVRRRGKSKTIITTQNFRGLYRENPAALVLAIKRGVPSSDLVRVSEAMGRPKEYLYGLLRFPSATAKRKIKKEEPLTAEQSERLIGLQRLIGQVETMVAESGSVHDDFDAAVWVADWLDTPLPALGNQKPAEFMDTQMGQGLVSDLLARAQSGAYA